MNYDRTSNDPERKWIGLYVFLGILIIAVSLFVGNSYTLSAGTLFISLIATAFYRKHPLPWMFLVSILAANPINGSAAFPSNLIFAFCLVVLFAMVLFELPRWVYIPALLSLLGFFISSRNWMSGGMSVLQQTNYMVNYLMMPFVLLPVVYLKMAEEKNDTTRLKGLLYCLILPSTLLLLAAYIFGRPTIDYKSIETYHAMDIRIYRFINTEVNFTRTHVGFIFASLICASSAIVILPVKPVHRLLAVLCLVGNVFLLLAVGSVGSGIASLCGLAAVFFCASLRVNVVRSIVSVVAVVCVVVSVWVIAPVKVKNYMETRYKERITRGINTVDRLVLWKRAVDYSVEHPEGMGWSLSYGDKYRKSNPHNDYLLYAINYGIIAGAVYLYFVLRLTLSFLRKSLAPVRDPSALAINLAGLGVVVVLLVNSMSDHLTASKWYFYVLWSIVWYAYFCSRTDSAQTLSKIQ